MMTDRRHKARSRPAPATPFLAASALAGATLLCALRPAQAAGPTVSPESAVDRPTTNAAALRRLEAQIAAARRRLARTRRQLDAEQESIDRQARALDAALAQTQGRLTTPAMAGIRGAGTADSGAAETTGPASNGTAGGGEHAAPIVNPAPKNQPAQRVLQTSSLQSVGGVLTPRGVIVLDPSLEYDYSAQDQLSLNGFTILPGITFGQLLIARLRQNLLTPALTVRYGVTDRLELSVKIPYIYGYSETVTQSVLQQTGGSTTTVNVLSPSAHAAGIGDIQFGASYQFNAGSETMPIFVGNLLYKTATGSSPFSVPIYTVNDPNGGILEGIQRQIPTGTGFPAIEPSLTVLYPTAPGILFGNLLYIHNFGRNVDVQNPAGGPSISAHAKPGDAIAATFGIGFALNDQTTFTFSYQQEHVFGATFDDAPVKGSSYDFGTFNFGIGYQISRAVSLNLGVGIGAGPNAPAAKILVDAPIRF